MTRRTLPLLAVCACFVTPQMYAGFTNASASTGITFNHAAQGAALSKGEAGLAVADVNGDGWPDLLGARWNNTPVLFMNQRDGTFREEAAARGIGVALSANGFAAADFQNDGRVDLFVAPSKGKRFYYLRNDGTGQFTDEAVARGADVTTTDDHRGFSVSVVDYDRDGYLDVYVCEWGPTSEFGLHSVLLRNRGAQNPGHFENVTTTAGLLQSPTTKPFYVNPEGKPQQTAFSAAWADYDGDGWPDLALISDFGASRMYWNNGNGTFTEGTVAAGVGQEEFGMGVAVADYDGDGRLDLYVTSIFDEPMFTRFGSNVGNKLYRNLGNRRFAEVSKSLGVARTGWGWGAAFLDTNNRGVQDLIVTNGMDGVQQGGPTGFYHAALTDPTMLFQYLPSGGYAEVTTLEGIADTGFGKGLVVWDYNRDGALDVVIADSYAPPTVYRNNNPTSNKWIRLKLRGTVSNRDGIGAIVKIVSGGRTQTLLHNPTNSYIGQHEAVVHAGLGALAGAVDSIEILWPSGVTQTLSAVEPNQVLSVTEPAAALTGPAITQQPALVGTLAKDAPLVLSVAATASPPPTFAWQKNGVTISGATKPTYHIEKVHPFDAGTYRVIVTNPLGAVTSAEVVVSVQIDVARHSVARWWDEFLLDGIRKDTPNPPVHARNLYHLSAAMWDAFWAYEPEGWLKATPVFVKENVAASDWTGGRELAQRQAISHAAYRVLSHRFRNSPGKERTLFGFRWLMQQFGCDPDFTGTTGNSPAAVGNRIGYSVLAATLNDGANEANGYADATGYRSLNEPLIVARPTITMADPSRWQALALRQSVTQNGIVQAEGVQGFVGVNARNTTPFALAKPTSTTIALDPGAPPVFGSATHREFVQEALDCIEMSSYLDPEDGATIDISPGAYMNNPLGTNAGKGYPMNPATGRPYASNLVRRGDYGRVLAEYWADGPSSETPPGHWNVVHNEITEHPQFVRRFAGSGPELSMLEWDVRAYLALNGAVHDAACAAWALKRQYDSARPISMVRYLCGLGQSSDPAGPSYHAQGIPLVPGLIEVVTAASSAAGQRHAHLADSVGQIAIRTWRGNPPDPKGQTSGVGWILARNWVPYQLPTFVSPAFPGYVSGHSTFSRAAAEVLTLITGTPYFPGGLGEYRFSANQFLSFEKGPSRDLTLQWATYYDAADQAGLSRLFSGIHPSVDDFAGRRLGSRVGLDAFLKAQVMRHGNSIGGLTNISTRGRTGTGEDTLIVGFVVEGNAAQPTLLRCVGPQLEVFGIPADRCEPDPSFELRRSSDNSMVLSNDNWSAGSRAAAVAERATVVGAFPLRSGAADAADYGELEPGTYTIATRSAAPAKRGTALAEVYGRRLVNLSTRGVAGSGADALISGFVVDSAEPITLLVRGVGPTLAAFGVTRPLQRPTLSVYRQLPGGTTELIGTNAGWSSDPKASLAHQAAMQSGAFTLPSGSADAALMLQLPAGTYTAILSSADSTEGVALVEVYHIK